MCCRAQVEGGVTIASLWLAAMGCSLWQPSEDEVFGGPCSYRPEPGTYTYDGELHQHFEIPKLGSIDYTETSNWLLLAAEPSPLKDGGT